PLFFRQSLGSVRQVTSFFLARQERRVHRFGSVFLSTSRPCEPKNAHHGEQLWQSVGARGRGPQIRDPSSFGPGAGGSGAGPVALLAAHSPREPAAHRGWTHSQGSGHSHAVRLGPEG